MVSDGTGTRGGPVSPPIMLTTNSPYNLNGGGKADLLRRNANTGSTAIWLLNGVSIASSKILSGIAPAWKIEQVGDTNGDGKADVVLKNTTTGEVKVWLMNGVTLIGIGSLVQSPPTGTFNPKVVKTLR
ncbi:MAG: hypothetical protein NPIRA06_16730 [Nitrospirales bacterium]|nr:MAG: hypothetical protein NPIRA06_16730 [Nitrospirales bacterium]